ncbi:MAG: excalibur calcium-binding domain-containing protein [Alphaproteobacteria bacterium]|nr:excalibur calcium-binding domain-containing protein [Alphaproteobacteria bacterium]
MAACNGATYQAPAKEDRLAAVHDNFKAVGKHGRLAAFGRTVSNFVRMLVVEAGRLLRVALVAAVVGAVTGFGLIMLGYSDPLMGLKHFASAPHCAFAKQLGVDRAHIRQPGYWKHHDGDRNGVACE